MLSGRIDADGNVWDVMERGELGPGEVELDTHNGRGPHIVDPKNPRRTIPDAAETAKRAAAVDLDKALALESRARNLAALSAKGHPGAVEALAVVEAEQAAAIEAAKASAAKIENVTDGRATLS